MRVKLKLDLGKKFWFGFEKVIVFNVIIFLLKLGLAESRVELGLEIYYKL